MTQEEKQQAVDVLGKRLKNQRPTLSNIDTRLEEYFIKLWANPDQHNAYEILGAIKFLRLLRTYDFDKEEVRDAIYDSEGEWQRGEDGFWNHIKGGLKQPSRGEPVVYRLEPFQVFCDAAMYGFYAWIGTGNYEGDRRLLGTERINPETKEIEDRRRLCTRFILYGPRKIDKSGFSAKAATRELFKGDRDAQIICTAPKLDTSKILFNKVRDMVLQLDPVSGRKFNGKYLSYSATRIQFQKGAFRTAELEAIPAGGKLPEGKFVSLVCPDEYGSAGYTNGKSDMGMTVAVCESSMGPRREPMTLITTTASLIDTGPFIEILDSTHRDLLMELKYDTGEEIPTLAQDRQMCLLLEPDEWERDDEFLLTSKEVRKKVNPMLGKIVQHSFYDDEVAKSRMDETKKRETISKLFNVYQSARVTTWLKAEQIYPVQIERRITECQYTDGWDIFVGLDFGGNEDLFAISYLGVNGMATSPGDKMFADCECWIVEKAMKESPNRQLYEKWERDGWLHVCPGEVFEPSMAVNELLAKSDSGLNLYMFGFDPAQSIQPINDIKAWLQSLFQSQGYSIRDIPAVIKRMVVSVPQTFMNMNGLIQEVEYMILNQEPYLKLSANPMWPWMFQNCKIEVSSGELKKPLKSGVNNKVDGVHALLDALYVYDLSQGLIQV